MNKISTVNHLCDEILRTILAQTITIEVVSVDLDFNGSSFRLVKDAPESIFVRFDTMSPNVVSTIKQNSPDKYEFSFFLYKNKHFVFTWNYPMTDSFKVFVFDTIDIAKFLKQNNFFR